MRTSFRFCRRWNQRTTHGDTILPVTCFTDSAEALTFWQTLCFPTRSHVSAAVNRHNVRISGSEQSHSVMEHARDGPKVTVWCGVICNMIIRPFFFVTSFLVLNSHLHIGLSSYLFLSISSGIGAACLLVCSTHALWLPKLRFTI
jgi:hypothetical protein